MSDEISTFTETIEPGDRITLISEKRVLSLVVDALEVVDGRLQIKADVENGYSRPTN